MMDTPIGFVTLHETVDTVSRKVVGAKWCSFTEHPAREDAVYADPDTKDVIKAIAEGCEAGQIAAAYRSVTGAADDLDRAVWRLPHWRNYFVTGTIELVLPLLDDERRPASNGSTARCTREIFVRRASLDAFLADLEPLPITPWEQFRNALPEMIRKEVRAVYGDPINDRPNVGKLPKFVRPRLNAKGFDASDRQIIIIGSEPEFVPLRRKPGKTKASDRPK